MTAAKKQKGQVTAEELVEKLARDPGYQARRAVQRAELESRARVWREAEQPIVADLRAVGIDVASVWDLVNTSEPYPDALPVLMEHLERGGYPDRVLEGVARALAVKPSVVYWDRLKALYLSAPTPDMEDGLGVALAACATKAQLDDLIELLDAPGRGGSRIFFLRPISKLGGEPGRQIVESLVDDEALGRQARVLLRRRR